jgi:hypothetical protein
MADKKISELDAITGSNTAATDVFVVVDTSTGQTKKITREELNNAIEQDVLSSIDIDTINGDFSVNGNINLGDGNKAIFGAGSDLQIYHDGSNSFIQDAGTGQIRILGDDVRIMNAAGTEISAQFIQDGQARLKYDNSTKLATTSTGIDVTGTVTADGLTVQGDAYFDTNNAGRALHITRYGTVESESANFKIDDNGLIVESIQDEQYGWYLFKSTHNGVGTRNRLAISNDGDIEFYEDTGTTAKFYWDASAERLGLGTTSPNDRVQVNGELSVTANDGAYANEYFAKLKSEYGAIALALETRAGDVIQASNFGQELTFLTGPNSTGTVERLRIDSSGRVGIGIASPLGQLHINTETAEATKVYVDGEANQPKSIEIRHYDTSEGSGAGRNLFYLKTPASGRLDIGNFSDGSSETQLMTFLESGNVGIGTDSPDRLLDIEGNVPAVRLTDTSVSGLHHEILGDGNSLSIEADDGNVGSGSSINFKVDGSERARLDSSGNLLVGKTSSALANTGTAINASGQVNITRESAIPLYINRKTTDGSIIEIRKDNSAVGSIGSQGGSNLYIEDADAGLRFSSASDEVAPCGNGGANRDNAINLGASNNRFKDLHLSGTANAGILNLKDTNSNGQINATESGAKLYYNVNDAHIWQRQGSEKARLDSSGNLLVGTTSSGVASSSSNAGIQLNSSADYIGVARSGGTALYLNRQSSDGTIADFRKDGTTVGKIGSVLGSYLQIGTDDTGVVFQSLVDSIIPHTGSATRDNAISLGSTSGRFKDLHLSGTAHTNQLRLKDGTATTGGLFHEKDVTGSGTSTNPSFFAETGKSINFMVNGSVTKAAILDSSGNLLVGGTGLAQADTFGVSSTGIIYSARASGAGQSHAIFYNGSSIVGYIATSTTATEYNTSSDQRLKENIADADDAGSKIDAIQVRQFDWKADGSHQDYGMIAQELQAVAPEAVSGDADSEEMMGVDYSKLVPMLIKEIQSLRNRVSELEGN